MKLSPTVFLLFAVVAALFFATSCIKVLDDELPESEPKLVVNSVINPDSVFRINVSRMLHVFENENNTNLPFIQGAAVRVFQDGELIQQPEEQAYGYYEVPGFYPLQGQTYKIEVEKAGFPAVQSTTLIPQKVLIESLDTTYRYDEDEYYYRLILSTSIGFQDPPNQQNYYRLDCYQSYEDESGETQYYRQFIDVDDINDNLYDSSEEYLLWNDIFNEGDFVTIDFNIYPEMGYYGGGGSDTVNVRYILVLSSLTKGYYQYEKSLDLFYDSGGSDNPFSQPVLIYSNIENGYGIFGGFVADSASFAYEFTYDY